MGLIKVPRLTGDTVESIGNDENGEIDDRQQFWQDVESSFCETVRRRIQPSSFNLNVLVRYLTTEVGVDMLKHSNLSSHERRMRGRFKLQFKRLRPAAFLKVTTAILREREKRS